MRLYLSFIAFAGLVSIQADQADACGLKLSKKAVKISEPIRPSTNPGRILLAGGAPRSLSKVLGQAGHVVASSESLDDVRDQQFDVVLVDDASLGNEARKLWPSADVLPISDRARANLVAVEKVRRREGASGGPTLIAKKEDRDPIKTGPTDVGEKDRTVVAAGPDEQEKREEAAKVEETPAKEEIVEEPVAKAEPVAAKE